MEDVKRILRKINKDLKNLNKTINYICKKNNSIYLFILIDIIWCKIIYGSTSNEYRIFEFNKLDSSKRKTYITKRKYNCLNRKYVDLQIISVINNKETFNLRFKDYLNREVSNINSMSFKQFEEYALNNRCFLARSNQNSFINSYKLYDLKDFRSPAFMKDKIEKDKLSLAEKIINQNKELNEISSLVFINVVSFYKNKTKIISSTLKYKDNEDIITGFIDYKKGIIKGHFRNEKGDKITNDYDGCRIPKYSEIIDLVNILSSELEELPLIEWTFVIGSKKICLVDANIWDDYVFSQIGEYSNNKEGLMSKYK